MKKLIAILLFSVLSLYGQSKSSDNPNGAASVFTTIGGTTQSPSTRDYLLGVGVAQRINSLQSIIVDISTNMTPRGGTQTLAIIGIKQDLAIWRMGYTGNFQIRPFAIIAYGATIGNTINTLSGQVARGPTGFIGVSNTISTSTLFSQQYAIGATIPIGNHGAFIGLGGKAQKNAGIQAYGYPFFIFGKTF